MSPVEPALSFLIPSLHDGTQLQCRIYHPARQPGTQVGWHDTCAIVAHPYAPLGGCYDDPVVIETVDSLLDEGLIVGTFNFRGSGGSKGRTSWTGKNEIKDYESFATLLLLYMSFLSQCSGSVMDPIPPESSIHQSTVLRLVLSGYSYGSLATMHLPGVDEIIKEAMKEPLAKHFKDILATARSLASESAQVASREHLRASHVRVGSSDENAHSHRNDRHPKHNFIKHLPHSDKRKTTEHGELDSSSLQPPTLPKVEPYYLFISPLMPPVSHAAMLPLGHGHRPTPAWQLYPALAIFGDQDAFSSMKKLTAWAKDLADREGSQFKFAAVAAAGHFWIEHGVSAKLSGAVKDWIHTVVREPQ